MPPEHDKYGLATKLEPSVRGMRFRSEEEYQAALDHIARRLWDEREQRMWGDDPKWQKYRQTWEEGTNLARSIVKAQACNLLLDANAQ